MYNFQNEIINWYQQNKRELPWRDITNPYLIWISEVILQQTRVQQGMDYYLRFISRFPNAKMLAEASEDEVLKLWQGLGYYSRARNLHAAAKEIHNLYNDNFPTDYASVLKLKGIGEYTAAAICSFAFNQNYAVVDGNVYRVLSRVFGIETPINSTAGIKEFRELAQQLLPEGNAGIYNQAIMEFGAIQCTPAAPDCSACPLTMQCVAFKNIQVKELPVKLKTTKVKNRFFNYLYIVNQNFTYIRQRKENDIWKNLFEFPLIETDELLTVEKLLENENFGKLFSKNAEITVQEKFTDFVHLLSHRRIHARFFHITTNFELQNSSDIIQIPKDKLDDYAVSRLTDMFLEKLSSNVI